MKEISDVCALCQLVRTSGPPNGCRGGCARGAMGCPSRCMASVCHRSRGDSQMNVVCVESSIHVHLLHGTIAMFGVSDHFAKASDISGPLYNHVRIISWFIAVVEQQWLANRYV